MLEFVKDWRTLIGGLLTLAGGGFIWHQTKTNIGLERARRAAQFDAALATLPLTLSDIVDWIDASVMQLTEVHAASTSSHVPKKSRGVEWVKLPSDQISELRKAVEYSNDQNFRTYVSKLLSKMQVCRSRLSGFHPSKSPNLVLIKTDLEVYLLDLIELRLFAESLFDFARHEVQRCPDKPQWERLVAQMNILHLDRTTYPWLTQKAVALASKMQNAP